MDFVSCALTEQTFAPAVSRDDFELSAIPEQLWQTTLDINARSLLQVKVKEVDDADDIFTKLMGELVEPRREFIQDNALAASVDV